MLSKEELFQTLSNFLDSGPKKEWRAGKDYVQYAGPFFDNNEILRAVNTLLDGWLVLGAEAYKAEKKLASMFDK